MSDTYTPTTEEVRFGWSVYRHDAEWFKAQPMAGRSTDPEFDRWLAAHDAQVRAEALRVAAEQLNEKGQSLPRWPGRTRDTSRVAAFVDGVLDARAFLHAEADRIAPSLVHDEGEKRDA